MPYILTVVRSFANKGLQRFAERGDTSKLSVLKNIRPIHPGEYLREDVLPALGKTKTDIARLLGVSRQTLYDILDEKQSVTAEMALRIGKLCGNGPRIWLALQQAYDVAAAEKAIGPEIEAIPTLSEIA